MSLVSTLGSVLLAALPRQVRHPAPRKSEGTRDFDAFMQQLAEDYPSSGPGSRDASLVVTRRPWDGPTHAVMRRARD